MSTDQRDSDIWSFIYAGIAERSDFWPNLSNIGESLNRAFEIIKNSQSNGGTLFVCGNGGSYAMAQHFVAELQWRFKGFRDEIRIRAVALGTPATLTAVANDDMYDHIFTIEFDSLVRPGDVLLCLSTSGKSPNILDIISHAQSLGIETILLTGVECKLFPETSEKLEVIRVASRNTPIVQELHLIILHILADLLKRKAL